MRDNNLRADLLRPGNFIKTVHDKVGKVLDDGTVRFGMDTRVDIAYFDEELKWYKIEGVSCVDPVMEVRFPTPSTNVISNYLWFDKMTVVWVRDQFINEILDPGDIIIYDDEPYVYVQEYTGAMISLTHGNELLRSTWNIDKDKVTEVYRPRYWNEYRGDYKQDSRLVFRKESDSYGI